MVENTNPIGILYPQEQTEFTRHRVYFDRLQHGEMAFKDIKKLKIKNVLRIKYYSINAPDDVKYIDRIFHWVIFDNGSRLIWDSINDKF